MSGNIFSRIFKSKNRGKDIKRKDEILVDKTSATQINECYNTLKNNVLFLSSDMKTKVIQMESSVAGEGKTTVCCNLAVSLSFNEKKVLIIDLDFRRPRIHRFFKLSNDTGLVDYMSDAATLDSIIKKTEYENLDIISRGSELYNPSLLLTSEKFASLIAQLREKYDYVFLDAPPVLQVSEYIHISNVSDGVLFVTAYGRTKKRELKDAAALLKRTGVRVIGNVMNFYDYKSGGYYGNRYYYYGAQKN